MRLWRGWGWCRGRGGRCGAAWPRPRPPPPRRAIRACRQLVKARLTAVAARHGPSTRPFPCMSKGGSGPVAATAASTVFRMDVFPHARGPARTTTVAAGSDRAPHTAAHWRTKAAPARRPPSAALRWMAALASRDTRGSFSPTRGSRFATRGAAVATAARLLLASPPPPTPTPPTPTPPRRCGVCAGAGAGAGQRRWGNGEVEAYE